MSNPLPTYDQLVDASLSTILDTLSTGSLGIISDGAAGTDTGSNTLISMFKRHLQRWTSFLALLPASLGPKAATASFSVVAGTYATVKSGEVAGSVTATQCPAVTCSKVRFKARTTNTGKVYIGAAGVTVPNGSTTATAGYELQPGADTDWLAASNVSLFYIICDNATDHVTYLAQT